ncbi:MAG: TSUP family transporter [Gammaproteobacteria bacterium]|nr:TSUP family transporter [Gammaproteobacteria bacterium]
MMGLVLYFLAAVFVTSLLSGVMGMLGGYLLILAFLAVLPVGSAMILHGIVQGVANGSRFWFLKQHSRWDVMPAVFVGGTVAASVIALTAVVPDAALVMIVAGSVTLLGESIGKKFRVDVRKPTIGFLCGCVVVVTQIFAGFAGPVLDSFFRHSSFNRFEVVATKAFIQSIGHLIKIFYYLLATHKIAEELHPLINPWFMLLAIVVALLGTWVGTKLLNRVSEASFNQWTRVIVVALAIATIVVTILK